MTKEFEQYIHDTRNEFVEEVNQLQWNTGFRTKCENLLIAYDQMKQALRIHDVNGALPSQEQLHFLKNIAEQYIYDAGIRAVEMQISYAGIKAIIEEWERMKLQGFSDSL